MGELKPHHIEAKPALEDSLRQTTGENSWTRIGVLDRPPYASYTTGYVPHIFTVLSYMTQTPILVSKANQISALHNFTSIRRGVSD